MRSGYRGQLKNGRPTTREATNKKISEALKITEEEKVKHIEKLQEAAEWDCSIEEMCLHSGISASTYNRWTKENPKLKERINELRNAPTLLARKTVNKKLSENYQNAMDYLKRKRKSEFSERLEQTGADGEPLFDNDTRNKSKKAISEFVADENS